MAGAVQSIEISLTSALPGGWEPILRRVASHFGVTVDRAFPTRRGLSVLVRLGPAGPLGREREGEFVGVVQQAFTALLDGREPMLLQQLVEVELGVRPPDRYAAIVEAAVSRCGGSASRITALPRGVSFQYAVSDFRTEVFVELRDRVVAEVMALMREELQHQPQMSTSNVNIVGSTLHGSNIGVGSNIVQSASSEAGDQYAQLIREVRALIDSLSGPSDDDKQVATTLLDQAGTAPPAQRAMYWKLLENITTIASKLPASVFERAAELITGP